MLGTYTHFVCSRRSGECRCETLQKVTVFDFENDNMFEYDFTQKIPVLIYDGELEIDLSRFI